MLSLPVILSLLSLPLAYALPTGAPKCQINPSVISAAHNAPSAAGYTLSADSTTWTAGQKVKVTLTGSQHHVIGVLMYATPGTTQDASLAPNGSKSHVGSFDVPTGFRVQTATICDAAKVVQDAPSSTITHMDPSDKGAAVTFVWTAPSTGSGSISFNAAITSGAPGNPWQVLDVLSLNAAGANGTVPTVPAGTVPAATSTSTTKPKHHKKKCGKKHHAKPSATADITLSTTTDSPIVVASATVAPTLVVALPSESATPDTGVLSAAVSLRAVASSVTCLAVASLLLLV
ncbi:hypothetical protein HKX48_001616 [Thoreauomyces humboldtii]|nr:hypothetical protein HKX48_001616 [Thoreauomyces humboldtii]